MFKKILSSKITKIILIFAVVLFAVFSNIGDIIGNAKNGNSESKNSSNEQSQSSFFDEFEIGTANIVVMGGLMVALGVIKAREKISFKKQNEIKSYSKEEQDL